MRWLPPLALALLLTSCDRGSASSVGPMAPFNSPDSIRYVQVEKDQPYALLWPKNNLLNLWIHREERTTSTVYPYPSCQSTMNVVLRGSHLIGIGWRGSMASAWTDSCTVTSATFSLDESGDTLLTGWISMEWTGNCGASRDTLPLRLARQ